MKQPILTAGVVFLCSALACAAQEATTPSGGQDSSKEQSALPAQTKPAALADEKKKKPKKVWTNEELNSVKGDVSVVGDHPSSVESATPSAAPKASDYDRLVDSYVRKLGPLRSDLADLDRKIQKVKEAKGNAREDTAAYLRVYADKRGDIQAKIDAILEDARRHGVAPGDLR